MEFLSEELKELPDERTGENKKYQVKEAVMAGFSVFFTQCGSFLQHQRLMKENKGKDNAQSLFGIRSIPCDNQIRNLLDPIQAETVFGTFKTVYSWLEKKGIIEEFKYGENQILISLDGTEYHASKNINCPNCNCREHKNGEKTYYHQVITPVIVSPNKKQVINLEPEFIRKQDGKTKQDCENEAVKRWLLRNPNEKKKREMTLLGDDLYSRQSICELALKQGYNFIFVAKESSHKSMYDWITNHQLKEKVMETMIISGRSRWKVENEGNNILKNQGYKLEHNFGHGEKNLAEILLTLNLTAFLFHNVLELGNEIYQKIRSKLGTRKTFFNDIRALLRYVWFESWQDLFIFIITEGEERTLIDTC
jgi:hypothetical protein